MLDLSLVIVEELSEGLDQVVVRDLLAERLSEGREVLGKAETHLPGLVLTGSKKSAEGMNLVLLLRKVRGERDERLKAHDTDSVLLILRQLSEDGQDLLKHVALLELGRELTEAGGASSTDHGSVLIAELDELLAEAFLLGAGAMVAREEQLAAANATSEPLALSELDDNRAEDVGHLSVTKILRDERERLGSLFTHNSLVLTSELLKKRQERSLISQQIEDVAELLGNGEENLVVLRLNEFCSENSKDG